MCDPLSIAVVSGVASAASAGIGYMGEQATVSAQQKANDDWVAYQRGQAQTAAAADEVQRQKADAARLNTLNQLTPENQQKTQTDAATNLTSQMLTNNPAGDNSNVTLLSGEDPTNTSISGDIASRVTSAARDARSRIAALAGLTSYGSGYGGMLSTAKNAIQQSNEDVSLTGDIRGGIAKTLGVAQQVPIESFTPGSNIAGSMASSLASLAGSAFGASQKAGK